MGEDQVPSMVLTEGCAIVFDLMLWLLRMKGCASTSTGWKEVAKDAFSCG